MDLAGLMDFAADIGLDAVDLTGYYFPSYPEVPTDQELFALKRKALSLGLDISWTGVRNNFVTPDKAKRQADLEHIKAWLGASAKLGAPIMRIFPGKGKHEGFSREEVKEWMAGHLRTCAEYGAAVGVLPGLQHHNDFLYTAAEIIEMLEKVGSDWLGLILDIGSLRTDPYQEIAKLAPYANYWFVKEHVYTDGHEQEVDMVKIARILKESGYRGYVAFESLSAGDPREIVVGMFEALKKEMIA